MTSVPLVQRDRAAHWEGVHASGEPSGTSWHQERPALSLELIERTGLGPEARVIDVGGGASTLVDHLLDRGYRSPGVLDISVGGLERACRRLGARC